MLTGWGFLIDKDGMYISPFKSSDHYDNARF